MIIRNTGFLVPAFSFLFMILTGWGCYKSASGVCGDGRCGTGETCSICPRDCGACPSGCGDGTCSAGETCSSCPADCGNCTYGCGDGICSGAETCGSCPIDCGPCPGCGDGLCSDGETCSTCPVDCGPCHSGCGDGICGGAETCESCPADCGSCTGSASVTFSWAIHNVPGGEDVSWGVWQAQEVCQLFEDITGSHINVQLWVETTGDDVADMSFDFECPAGTGLTSETWEAGDSLTYAFALVDHTGMLLSRSLAWERTSLRGGINNLGTVNFYVGDYGPLEVELQWADKVQDPAFGGCDFPPDSVAAMGYLLCWGAITSGSCLTGYLYDEVDIDLDPVACRNELVWEITDFGAYTLLVDGEDMSGMSIWGMECQDLLVDSMEQYSNQFICQALMTLSP